MSKSRPLIPDTLYTQEIADEVCQRLAEGESLEAICRDEHLPGAATIRRWVMKNHDGFATQYHEARTLQAEKWADELIDVSDNSTNDYMDRVDAQGNVTRVPDHENIARARLRVDTRKWVLSKLLPKKYGDKLDVTSKNLNVTVDTFPINDPHEAVRAYQRMIRGDDNAE